MDHIRNIILQVEELKSQKKFKDAIAKVQTALSHNADDYRLYEELADIYLYISDFEKAISALDFALTLNPQSATGNYLKGFILLGEDKVEEALVYLEDSNKLFGNNAEVLRNLGWAYTLLGQQERGIIMLKRALNIAPEDELITEDLAMALIGKGEILAGNRLLKKIGKPQAASI
ncbi:tetratricopeptide repeat protein [Candidatus Gracilibacteria bacterium]|nr:tetratricopeptide repeat protein [Candidatus Gracilibacteria bacterium]